MSSLPNSENSELERLREENDQLRVILAFSKLPCIYCQLPSEDLPKCKSGFPGCARMDDICIDPFGEKYGRITGVKDNRDSFCHTDASGDCISEDPRCMHQAGLQPDNEDF